MKVGEVVPCIYSPNWEDEHIADGYYGMPQLRVYGGGDSFFDCRCPKCGRGGLFQYKSAYLALRAWNETQKDLRRIYNLEHIKPLEQRTTKENERNDY